MSIEQEKMIVEALPSLYPLQEFEEKAIHKVIDALQRGGRVQEERGDGMSGFYFAHRLTDEIGLSFTFVYIPKERGIQISLMFGCLMLAIGYNGREVME